MGVQFGRWKFDGNPPLVDFIKSVDAVIAPYGTGDSHYYKKNGVGILYRAFHTTRESRTEPQPHTCESGAVMTWDGCLYNRGELIQQFNNRLSTEASDVSIVATAYDRWGTDCFAKFIGDWALSIWNANDRSLILAKDPFGTRHLHYSVEKDHVTWSTVLDPVVLFAERTFALEEEYIAGWLSFFPAAHLTPYVGIHSVPPSSFVLLGEGRRTVSKYWDFDPGKRIRYRTDADYEEHFRTVFAEAIRRRLRSDTPVLAELSGGIDSSSIVCIADTIVARGGAETPRVDTLSYYNDSEPNWNERPYFSEVEEKRGRTGCHIEVSLQEFFSVERENVRFAATPGSVGREMEANRQLAVCMGFRGNRVLLSGIGGDEVTGGVPTPTPEFEDLLARVRFETLTHQLKTWALNTKQPWLHLLCDAMRGFLPPTLIVTPTNREPPAWLHHDFVKRHRTALTGYPSRVKLFGALPSFQQNICTVDLLRRQLSSTALPSQPFYEKRYPYLDRDLMEFLFAIPREQLVRPGQRRSLMRRALVGIVPDEILNRKRKAYVTRAPMTAISAEWTSLAEMSQRMVATSLGIVDANAFRESLQRACRGLEAPIVSLMRTLLIEGWLRGLQQNKQSNNLVSES